ncbi:MAG: RsmG family class I SAM-dependent methyltransferase [bacterium]
MTTPADNLEKFSSDDLIKRHGCDRLDEYLALLDRENQIHNLVSRETSASERRRLAAESLAPLEKIDAAAVATYLDIGSGGGLPAFPLLLCRSFASRVPAVPVLLDRSIKKTAALRRIATGLGIQIEIEVGQFEEFRTDRTFDLITARLVRITSKILKRAVSMLSPDGTLAVYSDCELDLAKSAVIQTKFSYLIDSEPTPRTLTFYTRSL